MRFDVIHPNRSSRPIYTRRRFQFAGALLCGALLPYLLRGLIWPETFAAPQSMNAFNGNVLAVVLAFWMRLSIEPYPGIRSSYVILPAALAGRGLVVAGFLITRFGYDVVGLTTGFILHVLWVYGIYLAGERRIRRRIAVVPFGQTSTLSGITLVDWKILEKPRLEDVRHCHAIVADFSADLPDIWEAFLADAALNGRIVYQVKQLSESLTGRVELTHLSENSFGSLLPARGYFYLKSALDLAFALLVLPVVLPVMAVIAIAIRLDGPGEIFFRQTRVGHAGRTIKVFKFRTMREVAVHDQTRAAITTENDARITRIGYFLRRSRLDELPQILNIILGQMSWIGPRPEAEILSRWYTSEIPFYRYRHVVKPGISGWAQVNQGHVAEVAQVHEKLQYDFYYVKYFSPWLDILIVFKTIKTMLTGWGAR